MSVPLHGLKLPHLRLVAAIAERGQLQAAAEDLGMTQPAASRMLGDVERLVGLPLFERRPKGMTPTEMGRTATRRARLVVGEVQELAREIADHRQGLSGVVRVGAVTSAAVACLVPAIRRMREVAPRVKVRADVAPSTVLMPALDDGALDFVIGRLLPQSDPADYVVLPGQPEPVAFLARQGHPLAERGPVPLADLARHDWVVEERGTPIRAAMEAAMVRAGLALPAGVVATSSLLVSVALLSDSDAVSPMGRDAAALLCRPPVGAGFVVIATEEAIDLPFYHIISPRGRVLPRAVLRLRTLVQSAMSM